MRQVKTLVILNPKAGNGRAIRVWRNAQKVFLSEGYKYDLHITSGPQNATQAARVAIEDGYELLVSVGGDGTTHEIINAPIPPAQCGLGVIPAGSGNDFAKTVSLSLDPVELALAIIHGRWRTVDMAKVNGEHFMNVAGIGFDAEVAAYANKRKLLSHSSLNYIAAILRTLPKYSSRDCIISLDDTTIKGKVFLAAIANGRYFGGGINVHPFAREDDGLLDLVVVWDLTPLEAICLLFKTYRGTHIYHSKVRCYRGRSITISAENPLWIQADGEILGQTPATIKVMPSALRVRVR